jgi:hypothetical protein
MRPWTSSTPDDPGFNSTDEPFVTNVLKRRDGASRRERAQYWYPKAERLLADQDIDFLQHKKPPNHLWGLSGLFMSFSLLQLEN